MYFFFIGKFNYSIIITRIGINVGRKYFITKIAILYYIKNYYYNLIIINF